LGVRVVGARVVVAGGAQAEVARAVVAAAVQALPEPQGELVGQDLAQPAAISAAAR
jgi:hypothetical protein